ncbi:MAG: hypothetical protein ACN4GZ_14500 [Acidimicrobiales bacterium]
MKKIALSFGLATGMIIGTAGAAAAGEYTGNGRTAPGGEKGKSECSYSGLDAPADVEGTFPFDDDPYGVDFHGVQSYGQFIAYEKTVGPLNLPFPLPSPGQACRGN